MDKTEWMKLYLDKHNIALIGFMGAGKSTVAEMMSLMFAIRPIEMDVLIAKREEMTINEIFAKFGEAYFRGRETDLLRELSKEHGNIISCGGGTVLRPENVELLKENSRIVLLTATAETILKRVKDSDDRPILNGHKDVDFIGALMEKRRQAYERAADIIVATDGKSVGSICIEIADSLIKLEEACNV